MDVVAWMRLKEFKWQSSAIKYPSKRLKFDTLTQHMLHHCTGFHSNKTWGTPITNGWTDGRTWPHARNWKDQMVSTCKWITGRGWNLVRSLHLMFYHRTKFHSNLTWRTPSTDRRTKMVTNMWLNGHWKSDAGSQYECGRVGRGIHPPSTPKPSPNIQTYARSTKNACFPTFKLMTLDGSTDWRTDRWTKPLRVAYLQLKTNQVVYRGI